jgi:hypothetical protein
MDHTGRMRKPANCIYRISFPLCFGERYAYKYAFALCVTF